MRLLSSVLPQAARLVPSAERGLSLFLVAFVVALELLGRQASSDAYDAVAGLALMSVLMFVLAWHRRYPLPWLGWANRLAARLTARAERLKYQIGIDFRGTPPVPRKAPRVVSAAVVALVVWTCIAAAAWAAYPEGWRELGLRTSYVAYLAVLMILWGALAGCSLAGVYLPVWVVDQRLKAANNDPDAGGVDAVALVGYGLLAVLVAWVTPPVYAVVGCLIVAVAAGAWYALRDDAGPAVLWRAGAAAPVYAVPLKRMIAGAVGVGALAVFALLVTASGGRLTATPSLADPMPLTALLGSLTAWLVPGVALVIGYQLWELRRTDPARPTPPTAHVTAEQAAIRWRANSLVARWGWRTRLAPAVREQGDVAVEVVPPEQSEATEFDPRWPLKVSLDDLEAGAVKERLARRDEIQLRRHFFAGMSKLLKRLKSAAPSSGGGFWIAPHWWFIDTVQWEEPDRPKKGEVETLRPLGPGFDRVFPPRVRQHLHQVLRATAVDLIYLEDGVGHRKMDKVLRCLFELYDIHGGKRPAEDHHFRGVPKVRVMIHEYAPGNPFKPGGGGYPEPKFDEVSRFRVLHVFKDRGGQEAETEIPFDFSWQPTPVLAR